MEQRGSERAGCLRPCYDDGVGPFDETANTFELVDITVGVSIGGESSGAAVAPYGLVALVLAVLMASVSSMRPRRPLSWWLSRFASAWAGSSVGQPRFRTDWLSASAAVAPNGVVVSDRPLRRVRQDP